MEKNSEDERTSLVFSVRGPIPIQLDDSMSSWGSGSSVLDLIFPQPETISEIRFRNWYTARLSILVRFDDSVQAPPKSSSLNWAAAATLSLARLRGVDSTEGIKIGRNLASAAKSASDWTISVQNKILMPDPHTETGSQDVIVINATESLVSLHDVTALRFILRQPSPNWKTFNVEEIAVYRDPLIMPARSTSNASSSSSSRKKDYHSSDSGISSSQSSQSSSSTKNSSNTSNSQREDVHILDQLARQTASALQGGRAFFGDELESSSSESSAVNAHLQLPTSYDIMSLNF